MFSSIKSILPRTDSFNESGGRAYEFTPKHTLAQMAATGCCDDAAKFVAEVESIEL